MMIQATQIRTGMILVHEGNLCRVLHVHHVTPGKGNAAMQTELRDLKTGAKIEKRFRPSEAVERAHIDSREMEYLYEDGAHYHFMDSQTYEQHQLTQEALGNATYYLQPNTKITVDLYNGEAIGVELPSAVELKIAETEPPLKGATAAGSSKQAKLENGVVIKVPPYLKIGDTVRVDPNTGEFVERV